MVILPLTPSLMTKETPIISSGNKFVAAFAAHCPRCHRITMLPSELLELQSDQYGMPLMKGVYYYNFSPGQTLPPPPTLAVKCWTAGLHQRLLIRLNVESALREGKISVRDYEER